MTDALHDAVTDDHSDSLIDWTDAFENGAYIPGAAGLRDEWPKRAAAFRASQPEAKLGVTYGEGARQTYDLFPAAQSPGTVIFVHGGYWHQTDISWWSHLASGAKARGWSVALAGYTLAPQATIPTITGEIAAAVTAIAERHPGPLRLAGHSAGGHLVSRMLCPGILSEAIAARIAQVVSISGVHHLVPLTKAAMNTTLGLTADTARAESPALLPPRVGARATFWVGAGERPEFLRQTRMITERWAEAGAAVRDVYAPGENHFSVIDALSDPESPLISALLSDQ